jgi:hypothetical protein
MTNKHQAQRKFNASAEDCQAAARYALRRTARKDVVWSNGGITFSVPMSWWSWGEKVAIDLGEDGIVKVFSKCVCQLHDWGKNQRNVDGILDWMEEYFELRR